MARQKIWTKEYCEDIIKNGFPKGLSPEYVKKKLYSLGYKMPSSMRKRSHCVWDEKDYKDLKDFVESNDLFKRHSLAAVANKLIALALSNKGAFDVA
jgi:hypothetical protein